MELDGDDAGGFPGFYNAVRAASGDGNAFAEVLDALVVVGIDGDGVSVEHFVQDAAGLDAYRMVVAAMPDTSGNLGRNVLIQGASQDNVHEL